jgi:hypothetical protein
MRDNALQSLPEPVAVQFVCHGDKLLGWLLFLVT